MASRTVLLQALFTQFQTFLQEMQKLYPEDPDFPMFQTTLAMLKTTNPLLVAKYVKQHVVDAHGEKIAQRDESFFMEYTYEEYAGDVSLDIVQKLKGYVSEMPPATKTTVWQYIDVISKLSVKILEQA
jgi:hypothetical protein